jgi:hypothetical protein
MTHVSKAGERADFWLVPFVMQAIAVSHVCERFLQHLVDSGLLTMSWRHWPADAWLQEGGEQGGLSSSRQAVIRPERSVVSFTEFFTWLLLACCQPIASIASHPVSS